MKVMHHVSIKKIICWAAVILFAAAILLFSSQDGSQSNQLSGQYVQKVKKAGNYMPGEVKRVIERIVRNQEDVGNNETTKPLGKESYLEKIKRNQKDNAMLRKIAHIMEYFLLGTLTFTVLFVSKVRQKKAFLITLIFCLAFAYVDEFYQKFIPGRVSSLRDVMIDFAGSILAVIILFCVMSIFKRVKGRNKHELQ
jgi:VanZ family protein